MKKKILYILLIIFAVFLTYTAYVTNNPVSPSEYKHVSCANGCSSDFINKLFDLCVDLLIWLGDKLGISYEAINIWIFVIIEPIIFIIMLVLIIRYRLKIKKLTNQK